MNDLFSESLLKSKTASEVEKLETLFTETQIARRACKIELQQGWVPASCFHALKNETRFGLHSANSLARAQRRLEQLCRVASAGLRIPKDPKLTFLTNPCRQSVLNALKIRAYRDSKAWSGT